MTIYLENFGNKLKLVGNNSGDDAHYANFNCRTWSRVEIGQNGDQRFRIFGDEGDGFQKDFLLPAKNIK